jgi:CHAT domain-containing protein
MKKTILLIIVSVFIAFKCQLSAQSIDSTLKWKALQNSTSFYYDKSDFETALKWGKLALPQAEKEFGKIDTNYCSLLSKLSVIYSKLGNNDKAIETEQIDSVITLKIFGAKNIKYANVLGNLALYYFNKYDYATAEKLNIEAMNITKNVAGENCEDYAVISNNLANVYEQTARYDSMGKCLFKSQEIYDSLKLQQSDFYNKLLFGILNYYRLSDQLNKADSLTKIIIVRFEKKGSNSSEYANAMNYIGNYLNAIAKYAQADSCQNIAANIFLNLYGENNEDYLTCLSNSALNKIQMGLFPQAEMIYLKLLEAYKSLHGDTSIEYGKVLRELGTNYIQMGYYEKALQYLTKSLSRMIPILGNENYSVIINLVEIGRVYSKVGRYKEADSIYNIVYNIFLKQNKDSSLDMAVLLINKGDVLFKLARFDDAKNCINKSISIYKQNNLQKSIYYIAPLNLLTLIDQEVSNYKDIESNYFEIFEIIEKNGGAKNNSYITILQNLAGFYRKIGKLDKLDSILKVAFLMIKQNDLENSDLTANLLLIKNQYYNDIYKFNESLECLSKAEQIIKKNHGDGFYFFSSIFLEFANVYESMSNYNLSQQYYLKALDFEIKLYGKESLNLETIYNNIGSFYKKIGEYPKSMDFQLLANNLTEKYYGKENIDFAKSLNNIGTLLVDMGEYKKAEQYYLQSLNIYKAAAGENSIEYLTCLNNLSGLYYRLNLLEKAEDLYLQVLKERRRIYGNNHPDVATSLNNLALVYQSRGLDSLSIPLFVEAMKIQKAYFSENNSEYSIMLSNLANYYDNMGLFLQAEKYFLESIKIRENLFGSGNINLAHDYNNIAVCYKSHKDYSLAEQYYIKSLNLWKTISTNTLGYSRVLNNLAGNYYLSGNNSKAEQNYKETYNVSRQIIKDIYSFLSEKEKSQFNNLFSENQNFLYTFLSLNNQNSSENKMLFYDCLLSFKGMIFNSTDKIYQKVRNDKDSNSRTVYNKWLEAKKLGAWCQQNNKLAQDIKINIDSVNNIINDYEKYFVTKYNDSTNFKNDSIITAKSIQKVLPENTASIELIRFNYAIDKKKTDSVFYAALILKHSSGDSLKSPDLVLLENGNDLEEKYFAKYSKMIKDLGVEYKNGEKLWTDIYINNSLKDMYVNFWQKIQEKLVGVKTVYLSVDGVYNKINLNTLINPETNKYLAEELDLRIVTSTRDLVNRNLIASNIQSGNKTAELFGNPKFNLDSNEIKDISQKYAVNKQSFENSSSNNKLMRGLGDTLLRGIGYDELPGTKTEIEKISEILKSKGWSANIHTGKDATEEAVKSVNSPKILHIATHGQFDRDIETSEEQKKIYENPLFKSKLILAGGENTRLKFTNDISIDSGTEDGYLTAYEVMNMNLDNTELVVLSACETGLGEIRNGEGVYGLQRAFQVAGAKSLIMSLWKVPDAPTHELMLSFYSKWLGGMDKRKAFRQSQMELAKNYPNFFYWGAFEIITN